MMMKNILLVGLCLLALALPVSAQQSDARMILERTEAAFRRAGGIEADFTVQTYLNGALEGSSEGVIRLKGAKFVLDAEGVKTWFDGRTQWSYLAGSDEVNVSEPTPEELRSINPYLLLSAYKYGYALKLGKNASYSGKAAYEVIMTTSDKNQDLQSITFFVAKDDYRPLGIDLTGKEGTSLKLSIKSYKTAQTYAESLFVFDKKAYPTAEVIDLR